jgi:hypothetical protein
MSAMNHDPDMFQDLAAHRGEELSPGWKVIQFLALLQMFAMVLGWILWALGFIGS